MAFVIFLLPVAATFSACLPTASKTGPDTSRSRSNDYGPPAVVGNVASSEITEASGIVASRCTAGVLWTQNDSGDGPFIYALNERGEALGTWRVTGAENIDWEDIATRKDRDGKCDLYLGEIGNNELRRDEMKIYKVREPEVSPASASSNRADPLATDPAETISFRYPDGPHNAETLLVHPLTGDIYVITKSKTETAGVFKIPAKAGETVSAVKVGEISVPAIPDGLLTGGDISPDGKRVALCDYFAGYELELAGSDGPFDAIWKSKPLAIDLGKREIGEAIGYSADGRSLFATTEGKKPPIIRVNRK